MPPQNFYTPEQIAQTLQVHHLTVLKLIRNGKLKSVKLGRVYRIRQEDFENFCKRNTT